MTPETVPSRPVRHRIEIAPRTVLLVLGVVAAVWLLRQLATVLSIITVALILVGTFDPLVAWLERRGLRRGRALVLVFLGAAVGLLGIVLLMVPPLVAQVVNLLEHAPKEREQVTKALRGYSWAKPVIAAINELPIDHVAASSGKVVLGYTTTLFLAIGYGISTLFLAIYLLADPARSKGMLYAVVPREHHVKLAKILSELKKIVGGYMRGQLITSLSISVFVYILLTVLGADNALAIALFAALTDIIPFVGGYIASTPVVVAASSRGMVVTLVVIVLMVLYQEFESRILIPRVYGRVLRLNPAIVVVALLVGGTLDGILGALLALPIAAGVQMLIRELHVDLPGASPAPAELMRRDEVASDIYQNLSEGADVVEAGAIAEDVAARVSKIESDESSPPLGRDPRRI